MYFNVLSFLFHEQMNNKTPITINNVLFFNFNQTSTNVRSNTDIGETVTWGIKSLTYLIWSKFKYDNYRNIQINYYMLYNKTSRRIKMLLQKGKKQEHRTCALTDISLKM